MSQKERKQSYSQTDIQKLVDERMREKTMLFVWFLFGLLMDTNLGRLPSFKLIRLVKDAFTVPVRGRTTPSKVSLFPLNDANISIVI
jgi:hypothetical protein